MANFVCLDQIYINILRNIYQKQFYSVLTQEEVAIIRDTQIESTRDLERKKQQTNILSFFPQKSNKNHNFKLNILSHQNPKQEILESNFNANEIVFSDKISSAFLQSKEFQILSDFIWMLSIFSNFTDSISDEISKLEAHFGKFQIFETIKHFIFGQIQFIVPDLFLRFFKDDTFKTEFLILNLLNSSKVIPKLFFNSISLSIMHNQFDVHMKKKKKLLIFFNKKYRFDIKNDISVENSLNSAASNLLDAVFSFSEKILKKCNIDSSCEVLIFLGNFIFSLFQHTSKEVIIENYLGLDKDKNFESVQFFMNNFHLDHKNLGEVRLDILSKSIDFVFGLFHSETLVNLEKVRLQINHKKNSLSNDLKFGFSFQKSNSNGIISSKTQSTLENTQSSNFSSKNEKFLFEFCLFCQNLLQIPLAFEMFFSNNSSFSELLPISSFNYEEWFSKMISQLDPNFLRNLKWILEQAHNFL